jgi:hypothetical protein
MESPNDTYVVKIANLAITTKEDDIRHMFGYIGRIEHCQMYPRKLVFLVFQAYNPCSSVSLMPVPSKVAFVKYKHKRDAAVALHCTNSILVDKCIQVVPWRNGKIFGEKNDKKLNV